MATCSVYGTIVNGAEQPIEGIQLYFIPASCPAINTSTGQAITPVALDCITSSAGYFAINLLRNISFVVIINAIGVKETIMIPDASSKNLFELTGLAPAVLPTSTGGTGGGGDPW